MRVYSNDIRYPLFSFNTNTCPPTMTSATFVLLPSIHTSLLLPHMHWMIWDLLWMFSGRKTPVGTLHLDHLFPQYFCSPIIVSVKFHQISLMTFLFIFSLVILVVCVVHPEIGTINMWKVYSSSERRSLLFLALKLGKQVCFCFFDYLHDPNKGLIECFKDKEQGDYIITENQ